MTKQYKHCPTGSTYNQINDYSYLRTDGKDTVPTYIVESGSDWELIEEQWPVGTILINDNQPRTSYTKLGNKEWAYTGFILNFEESVLRRHGWKPSSINTELSKESSNFKIGDKVGFKIYSDPKSFDVIDSFKIDGIDYVILKDPIGFIKPCLILSKNLKLISQSIEFKVGDTVRYKSRDGERHYIVEEVDGENLVLSYPDNRNARFQARAHYLEHV